MSKNSSNKFFVLFLTLFTITTAYFIFGTFFNNSFLSVIISIILGLALYASYFNRQKNINQKNNNSKLRNVSKKRMDYYRSRGLSDKDIVFFRETMNKAKEEIINIEKNIDSTGKLKAISNRNNTLNLIKVLFKDIVKEPERLHEVNQFLYVHLPSLLDLTNNYIQIDQHQAKNKETYELLDKSAQTIDEVCKQISDDYIKFRSIDIDNLSNEMDLANKRLNRENSTIENDEI